MWNSQGVSLLRLLSPSGLLLLTVLNFWDWNVLPHFSSQSLVVWLLPDATTFMLLFIFRTFWTYSLLSKVSSTLSSISPQSYSSFLRWQLPTFINSIISAHVLSQVTYALKVVFRMEGIYPTLPMAVRLLKVKFRESREPGFPLK